MKFLLKINKDLNLYPAEKNNLDGYILGINDFSICFGRTFNIDEIKKIRNENIDKKIYVSLNRVIFNNELDNYKDILFKLDELNLDGIIVGDVAALTYNLKTNIILDQLHLNNSFLTIKHYKNNNVRGIVLTNDIPYYDINKIKEENSDIILFKQVFGLAHLSTSKRKLVSNYLKHFNINNDSNYYEIKENNKEYSCIVKEDEFGTHIFNKKPLNLLSYIDKINADYFVIDDYLIDVDIKELLEIYNSNNISKDEYINTKYNADTGFINKETIYKVKNNE